MNKIITNTLFMIIVIIIFVVLGNLLFLSNISMQIEKTENAISTKHTELDKLKKSLNDVASDSQRIDENIVLTLGQEGQLMSLFINKSLQNYFKVSSYNLYSSYYFKPESSENNDLEISSNNIQSNFNPDQNSNQQSESSTQNGKLPKLDEETGMPIGASSAEEEDNWKGLNIIPIKLTYLTKADHLKDLFKYFESLPVNAVRSADFIFEDDKVSGTLVFTFPLNEYDN